MAVRVQVPASTANLGPAFDCAAIALNLYLRVSIEPRDDTGFEIDYRGVHADRVSASDENLVVKALQSFTAAAGSGVAGARIEIENEIPIGVGLGSSAAAIVGGLLAVAALDGGEMNPARLLPLAVALEHHPDNVAAALYGGFVVAATVRSETDGAEEILVHRSDVAKSLRFVVVTPQTALPTEKARSILPAEYSRADAVQNLQRAALLTAAFVSGEKLSPEMFRDRLHQPYRAPLIPGIADCLEYRADGVAGVFLSGAGSSVMAIATKNEKEIGDALVALFRRAGTAAHATVLQADNQGGRVL